VSIETFQSLAPFVPLGNLCWFCGKQLTRQFIYWHGEEGGIALHPSCADDLAGHLMLDTAKLRMGDKPR